MYIEREAVINSFQKFAQTNPHLVWDADGIANVLNAAPTFDAAPVVHGEWLNIQGGFWRVGTCSVCGEHYPTGGSNYCPNCGAKMKV